MCDENKYCKTLCQGEERELIWLRGVDVAQGEERFEQFSKKTITL